jgi:lipopolysaccharide export system permease protein
MSLIHRHILWNLFKASAAAVGLFTFILITGNAIREILSLLMDGRMDLGMFMTLIGLLLPYVISYALPMGVLMGVLTVLGRMCAQSEYTAYRASGVSLYYLAAPIFIFAAFCSVCLTWINFYYAPTARGTYFTMLSHSIKEDPLKFILPKTFVKEFPGYILYARSRDGNTLRDFWIWELDAHNRPVKLVRSSYGTLKFDTQGNSLILDLQDGFSELRDSKNPDDLKTVRPTLSFDHANVKLPMMRLLSGEERGGLTVMTIDKMLAFEKDLQSKVSAKQATSKEADMLSQVRFQIQQNLAFALAVVALCLVGVPLGLKASRREASANLTIAVGLALGYYFLIVVTSWASRMPQIHPEILVWLPNLAFIWVGVWLLKRANRGLA